MVDPRDLTEIERAVVAMISKPLRIPAPWADVSALFVLRATENPEDLLQAVYNICDWAKINDHMEQPT